MRKPKRQPIQSLVRSLEELISDYDRDQLVRALQVLKSDLSWEVFRAMLIKESLRQNIYAQDATVKTGMQIEAAYHTGISQALLDTATTSVDRFIDLLENKTSATENPRPQE